MLDVAVLVEAGNWPDKDWQSITERAAIAAVLASPHAHLAEDDFDCELAIKLTNDNAVQALNAQYRGKNKPTNVLSFPLVQRDLLTGLANSDDGEVLLGDIALAFETCTREAEEKGISLTDHAVHLIVHGVLHVIGYDHEEEAAANEMERMETAILDRLGIPDPYAVSNAGERS